MMQQENHLPVEIVYWRVYWLPMALDELSAVVPGRRRLILLEKIPPRGKGGLLVAERATPVA